MRSYDAGILRIHHDAVNVKPDLPVPVDFLQDERS